MLAGQSQLCIAASNSSDEIFGNLLRKSSEADTCLLNRRFKLAAGDVRAARKTQAKTAAAATTAAAASSKFTPNEADMAKKERAESSSTTTDSSAAEETTIATLLVWLAPYRTKRDVLTQETRTSQSTATKPKTFPVS